MIGLPLFAISGAAVIDPQMIGGMVAWYDANNVSPQTPGANITSATDRSGTGNNLTQGGSFGPTWNTSQFGSQPGIVYPALAKYLYRNTKVYCANGYSIFSTFKTTANVTTSSHAANAPQTIVGDVQNDIYGTFGLDGGNVCYTYYTGTFIKYKSTGLSLNDGQLHTVGATHSTSGAVTLYADGIQVGSATGVTYQTLYTGFTHLGIGYTLADHFRNGSLAETMVWNASITGNNMQDLHNRALRIWA